MPAAMPFSAVRRHRYCLMGIRYVEDHGLGTGTGTGKPAYVVSVLKSLSRAILVSAVSPRQDLTAYLIVLRAAVEARGAPEALASDGGGMLRANHAKAVYAFYRHKREHRAQVAIFQDRSAG